MMVDDDFDFGQELRFGFMRSNNRPTPSLGWFDWIDPKKFILSASNPHIT